MSIHSTTINTWFENIEGNIEPSWKRLGFVAPPDRSTSGKGIGIIILDDIVPNKLIAHLGKRVKQVKVRDDSKVLCIDLADLASQPLMGAGLHGMMILQLLAHLPLTVQDKRHVGISPAAHFIFISEVDPAKIEVALKWVLQKQVDWNIKILLNTVVPSTQEIGAMRRSSDNSFVQALHIASESGILIISANGNSKVHNNLHPAHFFTVGGYDDDGLTDISKHKEHPASPWGVDGDGFIRPDILAPFTYLPLPYCESQKSKQVLSFFGGSCGSSTLIAGVCAHLLSKFPYVTNDQLINLLINNGDPLQNSNNPAPKICVDKVIHALSLENNEKRIMKIPPYNRVTTKEKSLASGDSVEGAILITKLIDNGEIDRSRLWELLQDDSPIVKKTVISYGLGFPKNEFERELYWDYFYKSEKANGVKIAWLYQLLWNATGSELERWMELLKENDLEINLCVKLYLEKNFPDAPKIDHYPITNLDFISISSKRILDWYRKN